MRSHRNVFEILSKFLVQVIVIVMILSSALMQNIYIYICYIKSSSEWAGKIKIESEQ